jgi:hypothetical protein
MPDEFVVAAGFFFTGLFAGFFFATFFAGFFAGFFLAGFFFAGFFLAGFFFAAFFLAGFFLAAFFFAFVADFFFVDVRRLVAMGRKGSWRGVAGQPQHAFCEDISLNLAGSAPNREGPGKQGTLGPFSAGAGGDFRR